MIVARDTGPTGESGTLEPVDYLDRKITYLPCTLQPDKFQVITLAQALKEIHDGTHKAAVDRVLRMKSEEEQERAKKSLPAYAFGGTFTARVTNNNLVQHSGLCVLDFDDVGDVQRYIELICEDHPNVVAAFPSTRQNGVKVLVAVDPIPRNNDEHRAAFLQVCEAFNASVQEEKQKDVRRLTFVSYDVR